jgi:MYXO-CTERM domain-containing protein
MNNTRAWTLAAFLTLSLAFGSLFDSSQAGPIIILGCQNNSDCGCDANQSILNCSPASGAGGSCSFGQCQCNPGFVGPSCSPSGACCGVELPQPCVGLNCTVPCVGFICAAASGACSELTETECTQLNGTYKGDGTNCSSGICDPATPTATATATATVTATATATQTQTPVAQGGDCADASQCATGLFCSDAVCCDTACAGSGQSCDIPGQAGTCVTAPAQAPAASGYTLAAMLGLLVLTGLLGLRATRR